MPDSCTNPAKPDRKGRFVTSLPAAYVNDNSIAFTKQTIKPIYRHLEKVFGGIRIIKTPEPPEQILNLLFRLLVMYIGASLLRAGAVLDADEIVTSMATAASSWNPRDITGWVATYYIVVVVAALLAWTPASQLVRAIHKLFPRR